MPALPALPVLVTERQIYEYAKARGALHHGCTQWQAHSQYLADREAVSACLQAQEIPDENRASILSRFESLYLVSKALPPRGRQGATDRLRPQLVDIANTAKLGKRLGTYHLRMADSPEAKDRKDTQCLLYRAALGFCFDAQGVGIEGWEGAFRNFDEAYAKAKLSWFQRLRAGRLETPDDLDIPAQVMSPGQAAQCYPGIPLRMEVPVEQIWWHGMARSALPGHVTLPDQRYLFSGAPYAGGFLPGGGRAYVAPELGDSVSAVQQDFPGVGAPLVIQRGLPCTIPPRLPFTVSPQGRGVGFP